MVSDLEINRNNKTYKNEKQQPERNIGNVYLRLNRQEIINIFDKLVGEGNQL